MAWAILALSKAALAPEAPGWARAIVEIDRTRRKARKYFIKGIFTPKR
jgi:hypothetical protein